MKLPLSVWLGLFGLLLVAVGTAKAAVWSAGGGSLEFMDNENVKCSANPVKIHLKDSLQAVNALTAKFVNGTKRLQLQSEKAAAQAQQAAAQGQPPPLQAQQQPQAQQPPQAQPAPPLPPTTGGMVILGAAPQGAAAPVGAPLRDAVGYGEYGFNTMLYRENGVTAVLYDARGKDMYIFSEDVPDIGFNYILAASGGKYVLTDATHADMLLRLVGIDVCIEFRDSINLMNKIQVFDETQWVAKVKYFVMATNVVEIVTQQADDYMVTCHSGAVDASTTNDAWDNLNTVYRREDMFGIKFDETRRCYAVTAARDGVLIGDVMNDITSCPSHKAGSLVLFGKGCGVLAQSALSGSTKLLAEFVEEPDIKPAGSVAARGVQLRAEVAEAKNVRDDDAAKEAAAKKQTALIESLMGTVDDKNLNWLGGGNIMFPDNGICPTDWPTIQLEEHVQAVVLKATVAKYAVNKLQLNDAVKGVYYEEFGGSLLKASDSNAMFYDAEVKVTYIFNGEVLDNVQHFADIIKTTKGAFILRKTQGLEGLMFLSGFSLCVTKDIKDDVKQAISFINEKWGELVPSTVPWTAKFHTESGSFEILHDVIADGVAGLVTVANGFPTYKPTAVGTLDKWENGRYHSRQFEITTSTTKENNTQFDATVKEHTPDTLLAILTAMNQRQFPKPLTLGIGFHKLGANLLDLDRNDYRIHPEVLKHADFRKLGNIYGWHSGIIETKA
eukprot:GHVS01036547.1.p1 GENE.GHVS01036547.1~~GHVS01036547.1.p1  ORF type:complete len:725 (+),score=94.82 GHVS01036547.1:209-2383(+)